MNNPNANRKPLKLRQLVGSVFAAMLGVQSDKNRQRDFQSGDPKHYIIIGIIVALLLIGGLIAVVNIVLANAS
jgi:phosphatidylglycerophosphatase A